MVKMVERTCIKRLASDVKDLIKEPLYDNNIYYHHDEDDMLKGYAMIIGKEDTIYSYGYYFFEFNFPLNYPHEPPKVIFHTRDGETRFHPNMYKSGKVCLSVLNTWKGESWTSCQTIKSILLILSSILENDSLLYEPGITRTHRDFEKYHQIIEYKNFDIAVFQILYKQFPEKFKIFYPIMKEKFIENYETIKKIIEEKAINTVNKKISTSVYGMSFYISYKNLLPILNNIYIKLK